jgi:hypothetical protein
VLQGWSSTNRPCRQALAITWPRQLLRSST